MSESDTRPETVSLRETGTTLELSFEALRLVVREGPDAGLAESFDLPLIRVGGGADNDLVLGDPAVSRHHLELQVEEGGVLLRDRGSTNGTYVRGIRVGEAHLEAGEDVRLGETLLRVEPRREKRRSLLQERGRLGELVGASAPMRRLYALLEAMGPTRGNVLVTGETGTGKELVARALHECSGLQGPYVVFDCAATDPQMIRSELFGHVKGAYTGADQAREGAFRRAEGGTLVLDEVGELPEELQPRLLRVLENRQVTPVGSDEAYPVQVRVVAATHRDLPQAVEEGRFRRDLYHRLAVLLVPVPALRERAGDVPLLLAGLAERLGLAVEFSPEATAVLEAHPWPGNVRELRNVLERAAALVRGRPVTPADLEMLLEPPPGGSAPAGAAPATTLEQSERRMIEAALERNGGNQSAAARELGISRSTLKRRLKEYGLRG